MTLPEPARDSRAAAWFGVALSLAVATSCATAPAHRPAAPMLGDKSVEAGVGTHLAFGREEMAVGSSAWVDGQVAKGVSVFVRGSGADFFSYQGNQPPFDDVLVSGGGGLRWTGEYLEGLTLGVEGILEYEQRTGPAARQLVAATFGVPAAEKAGEGFWVYTDVQLGLAVPFATAEGEPPFFGFMEVPLGLAWQPVDWLVVMGEGGLYLPLSGGYGAVAVSFRL